MHLASLITLSGMALSGVAMISFSTLAEASIRLVMSEPLSSSPAQLTPMKIEQMPSTRRNFGSNENCRILVSSFCAQNEHLQFRPAFNTIRQGEGWSHPAEAL